MRAIAGAFPVPGEVAVLRHTWLRNGLLPLLDDAPTPERARADLSERDDLGWCARARRALDEVPHGFLPSVAADACARDALGPLRARVLGIVDARARAVLVDLEREARAHLDALEGAIATLMTPGANGSALATAQASARALQDALSRLPNGVVLP